VQQHFHRFTSFALLAIVASVVVMAIFGPAPAAPANTPTDTFTHVDLAVSDNAITVKPSTVPAGPVEVSVTDHRSNQGTGLVVSSPLGVLTFGRQVNAYRALGNYTLRSGHATGVLTIVAPQLHAATDEDTLHIVIRPNDFTATDRDVRREEPTKSPFSDIPQDRDWTAIKAGDKTFILDNQSKTPQTCGIPSLMPARNIAPGGRVKMSLTFAAQPYEVRCTTGTFGVWSS
jgi:hypothetical protein